MKRETFAYLFLLFFSIIVLPGISIMSSCHAYASLTVVEVDNEDEEETSSSGQTGDIKYGISSSNFLNGGYFAFHENDCYYVRGGSLYKGNGIEFDDSVKIQSKVLGGLNIVDDTIFYYFRDEIRQCSLDGTSDKLLLKVPDIADKPSCLYVMGNWIYFSTNSDKICRVSVYNLSEIQILAKDVYLPGLCPIDGHLYYVQKNGVTKMDPDGKNKEIVFESALPIITDGEYIFQYSGKKIIRYTPDGESVVLFELGPKLVDYNIKRINCCDGWVYFIIKMKNGMSNLGRVKTEGREADDYGMIALNGRTVLGLATNSGFDRVCTYSIMKEEDGTIAELLRSTKIDR